MLTKKKKLSKKEIKQDKLVETYYKAYNFVVGNSQRLIIYGIALGLVVFAAIFIINKRKENNEKAGIELSRAVTLFNSGNYREAIDGQPGTQIIGLKKIVEDYGSTPNGETAKIYLADAYSYLGKTEDAYNAYKDYDGSIDLYKASSLAGQAGYFVDKGDFEKAADLYNKAANVYENNVLNADYLLKAGINYMKAGKNEKAKESFEKIKNNYASSSAARDVQKYMVQLD